MYTLQNVREQIRKIGVEDFVNWILHADFTDEEKCQLERIYILSNGVPCLSAIYYLAR